MFCTTQTLCVSFSYFKYQYRSTRKTKNRTTLNKIERYKTLSNIKYVFCSYFYGFPNQGQHFPN